MSRDPYSSEYRPFVQMYDVAKVAPFTLYRCTSCNMPTTIPGTCVSFDFDRDETCGGELAKAVR